MLGRRRDAQGRVIPGAQVSYTHDLVALGLAWWADVEQDHRFVALEQEIKGTFRSL